MRGETTELLLSWRAGDETALARLVALLYDELHGIAAAFMARERDDHTLQPTALIHEAYMRLVDYNRMTVESKSHFLSICARVMRRILVDVARSRSSAKRGSGVSVVALDEDLAVAIERGEQLIALDDALTTLNALDARKARVVEMRFFGGMNLNETASALGISPETVTRDWRFAKSWLLRELRAATHDDAPAMGAS